ncbi:MAG TPA: HAMP domain-containing sensor histidine kinase [Thermoanaerobaculia bacterium]|nr:HAMP domain-containing sensor histidine kinase [Thermoanaerobaculia bacterium]
MTSGERARLLPPAIAVFLLLLLAALATLQYQWIGRVSDLERQRMRENLQSAGSRFTEDFDRELTRAFLRFHPEPGGSTEDGLERGLERILHQYDRWRDEAPWPELIAAVFAVRRTAGGTLELSRLRPEARRFEPVPWPAGFDAARQRLATEIAKGQHHFPFAAIDPEVPGLTLPLSFGPASDAGGTLLFLQMDRQVLAEVVLPELTRRHFGSPEETDYALAVLDAGGRAVFRSDPDVPLETFHKADLRLGMLGLRPFHEMRSVLPRSQGRRQNRETVVMRQRHGPFGVHIAVPRSEAQGEKQENPSGGAWQLAIQHRVGSLEAAVAHARYHNMAVSLGILALVAITSGLMVVTTQRAQRLARQQIEFVAGVTHELHTPLTAIRSAGQNLADGVVADAQQVRRYGSLIEREGRRLTDLVGQVLELAGIQSGRRVYQVQPEDVEALVEGALEDCRVLLDEKKVRVEREIPTDLPPVLADGAALRRALRNLIENAARHATGSEGWIGLQARGAKEGVEITVADHGPGIRREDLPHLFKPFYRGKDTKTNGVPGSGLGLSVVRHVVEALGGRVSVVSSGSGEGERGSAFTLHLPAARSGEPA